MGIRHYLTILVDGFESNGLFQQFYPDLSRGLRCVYRKITNYYAVPAIEHLCRQKYLCLRQN